MAQAADAAPSMAMAQQMVRPVGSSWKPGFAPPEMGLALGSSGRPKSLDVMVVHQQLIVWKCLESR